MKDTPAEEIQRRRMDKIKLKISRYTGEDKWPLFGEVTYGLEDPDKNVLLVDSHRFASYLWKRLALPEEDGEYTLELEVKGKCEEKRARP